MHIYLIRHPPPIDVDGLCYGRLDVAVDPKDVVRTADSIFEQIPGQTLASARIYCSPSLRCMGLARHIASPRQPTPADDLIEMSFGHWQGIRWDAIARLEIVPWPNELWGYRPGGGETAREQLRALARHSMGCDSAARDRCLVERPLGLSARRRRIGRDGRGALATLVA